MNIEITGLAFAIVPITLGYMAYRSYSYAKRGYGYTYSRQKRLTPPKRANKRAKANLLGQTWLLIIMTVISAIYLSILVIKI